MIKPGESIHINDEEYQGLGDIEFYRSKGESSTRFELQGLQRLSDGSRFYVTDMAEIGNEPELLVEAPGLVPAQADWQSTGDIHEWRVTDKAFGTIPNGQYRAQRNRGHSAVATETLPPPMAGARTLITVAPADDAQPRYFFAREILKGTGKEQYYTDDTPASGIEPTKLDWVQVTPAVFRWLSLVVVLAVVGLLALDLKSKVHPVFDWVKLYWYLGLGSIVALFLRRRYPFRTAFYFFATAFLLYFQTLFIEYLLGVTQTSFAWNVEGMRIAGILLLLVVLDLVHPKSFSMIAHAALFSGLISLFFYSCGFAIYALNGNPWSSYRQNVGGLPHGYIWLLVFVGFLIYRIRDYRLVPVKLEGALALHRKMEQGFAGALATVHKRAGALSHMADDFGDSLMVSNERRLSAAMNVYPRYQALSAMMKAFADIEVGTVGDPELVEQDLATLRADLKATRVVLERANAEEPFPGIRLSPHLLAATRKGSREV